MKVHGNLDGEEALVKKDTLSKTCLPVTVSIIQSGPRTDIPRAPKPWHKSSISQVRSALSPIFFALFKLQFQTHSR